MPEYLPEYHLRLMVRHEQSELCVLHIIDDHRQRGLFMTSPWAYTLAYLDGGALKQVDIDHDRCSLSSSVFYPHLCHLTTLNNANTDRD
jgi:hypothetical protein